MSAFTEAISANIPEGYHLVCGNEELGFSWSACECCGSSLGGDRHELAYTKPGTAEGPIMISACTDCLIYAANGEEPENWEA